MLLSLSINDVLVALSVGLCFILASLFPSFVAKYATPLINIIMEAFLGGGLAGDSFILVAIGINRLVSYVFPHKMIWYPNRTKYVIAFQWMYGLAFGLSAIHHDLHGSYYQNQTTGFLVEKTAESPLYLLKAVVNVLLNMLAGITLAIVYSVCVGKLIHYKMTTNVGQASNSIAVEARLSFQGFFLSLSVIATTVLYGVGMYHNWFFSQRFLAIATLLAMSNFILGPFIAISMSRTIREHIWKLFKHNNNVVQVLPPANNGMNH